MHGIVTLLATAALTMCCTALTLTSFAQVTSISVETVQIHAGPVGNSDSTGMTTYRLYAEPTDSTDLEGAVYGSAAAPVDVSIATAFFEHPTGGSFGG